MSIERRWNRNEVSRESPDKEVNRRPTSLKKFRADALRGPRVSVATSLNIKSGGREEYLVSFLFDSNTAATRNLYWKMGLVIRIAFLTA